MDDDKLNRKALAEKRLLAVGELPIRQAMREGAFENLENAGKPIEGIDDPYDELWWVKQLMKREQLSVLPASLQLRREVEEGLRAIDKLSTEAEVRAEVESLNAEIRKVNSTVISGPATTLAPLEAEKIVEHWRARRAK